MRDLGHEAARDAYLKGAPCEDRDRFRDLVHPDAFSDAMDEYPDVAAAELSGVVDEGITTYLDNVGRGRLRPGRPPGVTPLSGRCSL